MPTLANRTYLAYSLGIALFATACADPPKSTAGESGFVDGYLDATSLNSMLSDASCTHLRVYNARRAQSDTKGTVIAIAVKSSGEPLYNGTSLKYRMYDRILSGSTNLTQLTNTEATTRIGYVKTAGEKSYATNFSKAEIVALLSAAGCNGVRFIPERPTSGVGWSMRMHPVKLSGTGATVNPAPPSVMCGEPCPTFCGGIPAYYIHL